MTYEKSFFLAVLADHLHRRPTAVPQDLDYALLCSFAKSHELEAVVYSQCKDTLLSKPELASVYSRLKKAAAQSLFLFACNKRAFDEVKCAYQQLGVRFFSVKGIEIAALYPIPSYRTMGDLDLVMSTEDRERIHEAMLSLGYCQEREGGYERHYRKKPVRFEIHNQLIYRENGESHFRRTYFNNFWLYIAAEENGYCTLDWNFHFLFLIEHTKNHFRAGGIGFRQFMDLAVAVMSLPELDWQWMEKELKRIELWDFACMALTFCQRWWGVSSPFPVLEISEEAFEASTDFIFSNGVFGYDNFNRKIHVTEKRLSRSPLPKPLKKTGELLRQVFIPYREAVKRSYCSILKGQPYLLPAVWIYRVFYLAKNRTKDIASGWKRIFDSDDVMTEHQKLMEQWGLAGRAVYERKKR